MLLTNLLLKIYSNTNSSYYHYYNYYNSYTNACKDHHGICGKKRVDAIKLFLHDVLREGSVTVVVSPFFIELVLLSIVISLDVVPGMIEQHIINGQ